MINLLTIPLLISHWGMNGYGVYVTLFAVAATATAIFSLQPWQTVIRYWYSADEARQNDLLRQAIILDFFTCTLGSVIFAFTSDYFLTLVGLPKEYDSALKIQALSIFLSQAGFPVAYLRISDKFGAQATAQYVSAGVRLTSCLIIHFLSPSFLIDIFLLMLPAIVQNLVLWLAALLCLREGKHSINFSNKSIDRAFFSYSAWINFKTILDLPINQLDKIIISRYLGVEATALYELLKKLGQIFSMVAQALSQVSFPVLAKRVSSGEGKTAFRSAIRFARLGLFATVGATGVLLIVTHLFNVQEISIKGSHLSIAVLCSYVFISLSSNSFIFVNVLFMSMGYIKKDTFIMILASSAYLALLAATIQRWQLQAVMLSLAAQVVIVVASKLMIISRSLSFDRPHTLS
ncbi:Membrane protein involved in the export of O-antigen and teichoic acid [Chitinasiproducens palmae]|uniref:Membrane protein involved in the export of O-antigen and teichoic acid n=1 Tax=Chitinasiproducens palmae TaxID=1770053 RepID=A0A1H2PRC2_9BURK|nr:Membrane protein involved in the export of O-antigen and teichoic acid [Chitinasiproducens palmae]